MEHNPSLHTLVYNLDLGRTKPDTVHRDASYCPSCDVAHLKNIMETRGHMTWLENVYPGPQDRKDAIIESDDCDGERNEYAGLCHTAHRFRPVQWQQVKDMKRFCPSCS